MASAERKLGAMLAALPRPDREAVIQAMSIPTYPARPINGGPFSPDFPPPGRWRYEPKYNGWRALLEVETGDMYNRFGKLLSIADEFAPAIAKLRADGWTGWLDCEALERRHAIGRGSLVILDWLTPGCGKNAYIDRRLKILYQVVDLDGYHVIDPTEPAPIEDNALYLSSNFTPEEAPECWEAMKKENNRLGVAFYEGFVAKELESKYPIQLRSFSETTAFWIKHRFV
jgi:hypothetical protein